MCLAKIASFVGDMNDVTCGDSISLSTLDALAFMTRNVGAITVLACFNYGSGLFFFSGQNRDYKNRPDYYKNRPEP